MAISVIPTVDNIYGEASGANDSDFVRKALGSELWVEKDFSYLLSVVIVDLWDVSKI